MPSLSAATQTERERPFASSPMLLAALPCGALVVDSFGVVREANASAARLLGLDVDALLGTRLADLSGWAGVGPQAGEWSGTCEIASRTVRVSLRPLRGDDAPGHVCGQLVLLEDLAGELVAKLERYEHVSRALHDVRVPLQAIGGAAEGLLRGWFGPLTDEQREFVAMIKDSAGHQADLFSQLFDVYTLSEGLVHLQAERVRIESVLREAYCEVCSRFESRGVVLTLALPDELPVVSAERARLRQILLALLDNACRYTQPGGSAILSAAVQRGEVRVDVRDTGVGIQAAEQPKIFHPFFRGSGPLREGRYGGLSLVIAQMLVELHGGRIWFESAEMRGSTFSFTIPIEPGA